MKPFIPFTGRVAFLDRANVDTDQIIPKQFLKRVERTGYGAYLFYDWRYINGKEESPDFPLNAPAVRNASILVAGKNFGCGSSREHAVWALSDYGIRVVIAPSFADIFYNNCVKNGVLPIVLIEGRVQELFQKASPTTPYNLSVNLHDQIVRDETGWSAAFEIAPFPKKMLLEGLDEIALTLTHEAELRKYEEESCLPGRSIHS